MKTCPASRLAHSCVVVDPKSKAFVQLIRLSLLPDAVLDLRLRRGEFLQRLNRVGEGDLVLVGGEVKADVHPYKSCDGLAEMCDVRVALEHDFSVDVVVRV